MPMMPVWFRYYLILHAIWGSNRIRVALEQVLNEMLEETVAELRSRRASDERLPTTIEVHEFMQHVASNNLTTFKQRELAHLMRIEGWYDPDVDARVMRLPEEFAFCAGCDVSLRAGEGATVSGMRYCAKCAKDVI